MKSFPLQVMFAIFMVALSPVIGTSPQAQEPPATSPSTVSAVIPSSALLTPTALVPILTKPERPLVIQVGSYVLYAEAHIPGSEYVGASGTDEGLQQLRKRMSSLKKDQLIVLYCGCCPWDHCPNIRPAYQQLRVLGFTHVQVLYLPQNFGTDWVDKGYPIAKGR